MTPAHAAWEAQAPLLDRASAILVAHACADFDAEVHRVLTDKIFPGRTTVATTEAFTRAFGSNPHDTLLRPG